MVAPDRMTVALPNFCKIVRASMKGLCMNSVQYSDFPTGNSICLRTALPGEDMRDMNCSFPQLLS